MQQIRIVNAIALIFLKIFISIFKITYFKFQDYLKYLIEIDLIFLCNIKIDKLL